MPLLAPTRRMAAAQQLARENQVPILAAVQALELTHGDHELAVTWLHAKIQPDEGMPYGQPAVLSVLSGALHAGVFAYKIRIELSGTFASVRAAVRFRFIGTLGDDDLGDYKWGVLALTAEEDEPDMSLDMPDVFVEELGGTYNAGTHAIKLTRADNHRL